jgi:circadian clock protein KaiC
MRVSTGLKKLDRILSGGLPQNSVALLSGGPGTGKTLMALKFLLDGAKKKEKCCFITLTEDKEELLKACDSVKSLKVARKYIDKNLAIEHIPMGKSDVTMKRFVEIIANYPEVDRIVIDNVNKLLMFSENDKVYRAYLIELIKTLKKTQSSLLVCETPDENGLDSGADEAFECDGVVQLVFLDLEEKPMRALVIHKMRYTNFDPKVPHELRINNEDIRLTETKVI